MLVEVTISLFYHCSMSDDTHVISHPRFPLFSCVTLIGLGKPGDKAMMLHVVVTSWAKHLVLVYSALQVACLGTIGDGC